jgi:anti-sigma regulatory factor (Ser/Thr protein kinase)
VKKALIGVASVPAAAAVAAVTRGQSAPHTPALPILAAYGLLPAAQQAAAAAQCHDVELQPDGSRRRTAQLQPTTAAAQHARWFAAAVCADWGLGALADTAAVVISELVTNAVTHAAWGHGAGALRLVMQLTDNGLVIEVHDPDHAHHPALRDEPDAYAVRDPGSDAGCHGAGLRLIAGLAAACGTRCVGDGKAVWATLTAMNGR